MKSRPLNNHLSALTGRAKEAQMFSSKWEFKQPERLGLYPKLLSPFDLCPRPGTSQTPGSREESVEGKAEIPFPLEVWSVCLSPHLSSYSPSFPVKIYPVSYSNIEFPKLTQPQNTWEPEIYWWKACMVIWGFCPWLAPLCKNAPI